MGQRQLDDRSAAQCRRDQGRLLATAIAMAAVQDVIADEPVLEIQIRR